jgi:hypothetical protein
MVTDASGAITRQGHRLLQLGVVLLLVASAEGFVTPYFAAPRLGSSTHTWLGSRACCFSRWASYGTSPPQRASLACRLVVSGVFGAGDPSRLSHGGVVGSGERDDAAGRRPLTGVQLRKLRSRSLRIRLRRRD